MTLLMEATLKNLKDKLILNKSALCDYLDDDVPSTVEDYSEHKDILYIVELLNSSINQINKVLYR